MIRPVVLIILDGWGYSSETRGNAIAHAATPTIATVEQNFPFTLLQASGISVGLPWNEPGNSEVGHMNMGTGTIRYQPLTRINRSILDGSFFKSPALSSVSSHIRSYKGALHIMGLYSSGSVHAYRDHLYALLEFAKRERIEPVFLHLFLDGRDSPLTEAAQLVDELSNRLNKTNEGTIASLVGRHYAMNRDGEWSRTQKAYELLVGGIGERTDNPSATISAQYQRGLTDEFIEPVVVTPSPNIGRLQVISDNDAVIFFNFREDSARQLTYAFVAPEKVSGFTPKSIKNLLFATMTLYEEGLPTSVVLPPLPARNTVSDLVAKQNWKQFKIAETEKYAHVTYFFNGGTEKAFLGEDRILIPTLSVENHADAPQMRAAEIGAGILDALRKDEYRLIVANFANADMISHTGDFEATCKGIETIDTALRPVVDDILARDGVCMITADHGHAEAMLNIHTGQVLTEHSTNPVPFYFIRKDLMRPRGQEEQLANKEKIQGILADVALTVLDSLGIPPPTDVEGKSLIWLFE